MKLSAAQERAYAAMRQAKDGKLYMGNGVTRTTVEAMERKGIVTLVKTLATRETRRRGGGVNRRTYVDWIAQLKPVPPTADEAQELDMIARSAQKTLLPSQRRQVAAYLALTAPKVARPGSPAAASEYNAHTAYAEYLGQDDMRLIATWALYRDQTGEKGFPAPQRPDLGPVTDVWTITEHNGTQELCRVTGATQVDAALAANALLNTRDGYDMRRLYAQQLDGWVKDFRAGGDLHRITRVVTACDAAECDGEESVHYECRHLPTGDLVAVRSSAEGAEADTRADIASLSAALNS